MLCSQIAQWNEKSLEHGALYPPYENEIRDLERMIKWGESRLKTASSPHTSIVVSGISIGSMRYCKAALIYLRYIKRKEITDKEKEGWPSGALQPLWDKVSYIQEIEQFIVYPPADILGEAMPKPDIQLTYTDNLWDVFVSHASEDKEDFVSELALKLHEKGIKVWFDKSTLKVGDSLRRSIDKGLASSKFGIVVLSHNFFNKEWPQKELDGLVALESDGKKVILPVWHNITAEEIRAHSPMLADRVAVSSKSGLDNVVNELIAAIED